MQNLKAPLAHEDWIWDVLASHWKGGVQLWEIQFQLDSCPPLPDLVTRNKIL